MKINIKKSNVLIVKAKPKQHLPDLYVHINNTALEQVSACKLLGFYITETLCWDTHISHITKKLNSSLKLLYLTRHLLDMPTSRNFYMNFIHPHLIRGIHLYYSLSNKNTLDTLFKIQKKSFRATLNVTLKDKIATITLAQTINVLPLPQLAQFFTSTLAHAILRAQCPNYLTTTYLLIPSTRPRLRQHHKLPSSSNYNKLQLTTVTTFNSLPLVLRSKFATDPFKRQLKALLLGKN
jgi:hypothetical protein